MDKKIKYPLIAGLGVAAVSLPVRAALYKPAKKAGAVLEEEKVDLARFRKNLSDAIKFRTIAFDDPEKIDWKVFDDFHAFLKERYPLIHEKLELKTFVRGSLMFRWKGSKEGLDPIALLAHQDVVPISDGTLDDWTNPPFEGIDDGEFIWGRGALDMKNHLIGVLESVETLLEEGFEPERDVYICLGHNEEVMSADETSGAINMCNYFLENGIKLDSVIDEGGAILDVNVKGVINTHLAGIGVAEKGYADVAVSILAKGGHSSTAPNHTAIGKLADVIKDIENHQFKAELSPMMKMLMDKLGRSTTFPVRMVTCNMKLLEPVITKAMTFIPPAASMIRTTTGITMASGSPAPNVLPQKATVNVNFRIFPGQTVDDVIAHLKKVIRNKKVVIELQPGWKNPSPISPSDSRCFKIIENICMGMDDKCIVAPYLVMGGTDSYYYSPVCENVYRYSPFRASTELLLTCHGTNERIPVACMEDGVKFFKRYIKAASAE